MTKETFIDIDLFISFLNNRENELKQLCTTKEIIKLKPKKRGITKTKLKTRRKEIHTIRKVLQIYKHTGELKYTDKK